MKYFLPSLTLVLAMSSTGRAQYTGPGRPYDEALVRQVIQNYTGRSDVSPALVQRVMGELDRRYVTHQYPIPNVYNTPPVPGTFKYRIATFQSGRNVSRTAHPPIWNGRQWVQPRTSTIPSRLRNNPTVLYGPTYRPPQSNGGGVGDALEVVGTIVGILAAIL